MAPCKHIRVCAFLLNGARGRGFSSQSFEGTVAGKVLEALQPHVHDDGKPLFSILTEALRGAERERHDLEMAMERERHHLEMALERERLHVDSERLHLQELIAKGRVDLLKAKGLNDTRGLFECLQEILATKHNLPSGLKGSCLWEAIVNADARLAACIEKHTNVPARNVPKQGLNCYNVYSVLSQHIRSGKSFAHLQVARGVTKFDRGPLSPEQVQVLLCIGDAAQTKLEESTE